MVSSHIPRHASVHGSNPKNTGGYTLWYTGHFAKTPINNVKYTGGTGYLPLRVYSPLIVILTSSRRLCLSLCPPLCLAVHPPSVYSVISCKIPAQGPSPIRVDSRLVFGTSTEKTSPPPIAPLCATLHHFPDYFACDTNFRPGAQDPRLDDVRNNCFAGYITGARLHLRRDCEE